MKIFIRLFLLAAAVALGWWLWTVFFPNPEKVVLKRMQSLAELLTFKSDISTIGRATRASEFISYFSVDTEIVVDVPELGAHTLSGRDEVRETANGGFCADGAEPDAGLFGYVGEDRPGQAVGGRKLHAEGDGGEQRDFGVQEMHFKWKEDRGNVADHAGGRR